MKTGALLLYLIFSTFNTCHLQKGSEKEMIISKRHSKTNLSETDTLWVSQNDTTVFKKTEDRVHRPCSNPELTTRFELLSPENEAYYFIHDSKGKLVLEGKYSNEYEYEGITYKTGNFYNSKQYSYKSNGTLKTIHYQEDGRNLKTEVYNNDGKLKETIHFDKKSSDKTKTEIYDQGQLKETRIYTSFDKYYTVKPTQ